MPAPDLSLSLHAVCEASCTLRLRPENEGATAGAFAVEILADGTPIATEWLSGLEGGTVGAALDIALDPALVSGAITARIDAQDQLVECDEDDNELVLPPVICGP